LYLVNIIGGTLAWWFASINNIQTLKRLNAGQNGVVVVRVDNNPPPQSLRQAAEQATHSGDLRSMHPAGLAAHARSPWDELRV
jgi:hypothetical protein